LVKSVIINLSQRPYLFNGKILEVKTSLTFINGPGILTTETKSDLNPLKKKYRWKCNGKKFSKTKKKLSNVIFISEIYVINHGTTQNIASMYNE